MNDLTKQRAAKIKLLILDVDGVLTDGKIYLDDTGRETKGFNSKDGVGIKNLLKTGVKIAVISGRESAAVNHRMNPLGVKDIYQNQADKTVAFNALKRTYNLTNEQIAYVGDDLPDLTVMREIGLSIAVADAVAAEATIDVSVADGNSDSGVVFPLAASETKVSVASTVSFGVAVGVDVGSAVAVLVGVDVGDGLGVLVDVGSGV